MSAQSDSARGIAPKVLWNNTTGGSVAAHAAGHPVALKVRLAGPGNVRIALNRKKNLCPIIGAGQPGRRLRSAQARMLRESVKGNRESPTAALSATITSVPRSDPEIACRSVASSAERADAVAGGTCRMCAALTADDKHAAAMTQTLSAHWRRFLRRKENTHVPDAHL
jgi:hypothetical protein